MSVSCTPSALEAAAKCFDCGPLENQHRAMQTYLLAQIALNLKAITDGSPQALAQASKCMLCLTPKQIDAITVYLLCKIVNA